VRDQDTRTDTTRDQSDSPRPSRPTRVTGLLAMQRAAGNAAVTCAIQAQSQSYDAAADHGRIQQPAMYDVLRSTTRALATSLPAEIEARFGGASAVPRDTDAGAHRSVPDVQLGSSATQIGARAYSSGGTGDLAMIVQRATAASPGTVIQRARYKKDENGQLVSDGQGGFVMEEEQASGRISAVLRPGEAPQPMTETQAREWLRRGVDEETRKRYDDKTSVIAAFLQAPGPSVRYGADDRERFYRDLVTFSGQQVYEEQLEVLNAVARLAFLIGKEYPARQFAYVGLGRSPAPLIAQLDKLHPGNTWHLPLSSFRAGTGEADNIINPALQTPNQMTGAVTPNAAPDVAHQRMLVKHFDEFFQARPLRGKDVLLIDYGQTSTSLVSAQFHLQQYVMHRLKSPAAVHALALHEDRHAGAIQSLRNLVTKPEKNVPPYHPLALIDRFTSAVTGKAPASDEVDRRNAARGEWDERFESFNLGGAPGNEANEPYLKVGKAFSAERFDAYSPYGSFPILDKSQEEFGRTRPRRNRRNDAYDVLSEEIDNAAF
jgi:hypothetical protein